MTIKDIALQNIRRRKGKAVFVLLGIFIAIATIVTVFTLIESMTHEINTKLDKYGANILIVPKSEQLALSYGGLSLGGVSFDTREIHADDLARIRTIKNAANIAAVGPITLGVISVAGRQMLLAGVDFQAVTTLKPWWNVSGALPSENEVLLGAEAVRLTQSAAHSIISINGRKLVVSGILAPTGSQDDQLAFAQLETAQAALGKIGHISLVEIAALCMACPIEEMVKQLSDALPSANVMAIQQVVKGRVHALAQFEQFAYGVAALLVFVGSLVVFVTMMGSVKERTTEIGVFRAIGFRKSHIMEIVLLEAAVISGGAGVLGYLFGVGATKIALRAFVVDYQGMAMPLNLTLGAGAVLLAVGMGVIASVYPALFAARLDPNDALRAL